MLHEKIEILKVKPGEEFFLDKTLSRIKRLYADRDEYKKLLKKYKRNIDYLQIKFYASANHALLVILQGMDTSGKDSMIRHVMSGVNPQGCGVFSFKKPSMEELQHDYLWRYQHKMPPSGMIGIFNRSYYEDIIVPAVHPDILKYKSEDWFNQRCLQINEYEKYLTVNKVVVMKFFLHLSKKEQKNRLVRRIESPASNWKFSMDDLLERKHWENYQQVYGQCLNKTSTEYAPWYILPADDKKNARIMLSYILCEKFCELNVKFPVPDKKHKALLKQVHKELKSKKFMA